MRRGGGVGVGLLRLACPPAIGAVDPPRLAERRHRGGSRRLPADLRRRSGACRARHGPRHRGVPPDRRDADETIRAAGHLGAAKAPQGPRRGDRRGSRGPRLRPSRARPAVGHRHHRAPHLRTQGLLRRGAGHLQPPRRGLVHRLTAHRVTGDQRLGHGDRRPQPDGGRDRDPQRPRHPVHLLGIHPTRCRLGAVAIDGLGRGLPRL